MESITFSSGQIKRERIAKYIKRLQQINIISIINNLPSVKLRALIRQAKKETCLDCRRGMSDEMITRQMIHIHLNETIENLTNEELNFLQSLNIKITTYRTYISEYRTEINKLLNSQYIRLQKLYGIRRKKIKNFIDQQCFHASELTSAMGNLKHDDVLRDIRHKMNDIQNENPLSRTAQIALYKMTAGREIHAKIDHQNQETKERRQKQYELIDAGKYIKTAEKLLDSDNCYELIIAICALTGRRPIEVIKTGSFEANDEYSIVFSGQAKKRGIEVDNTKYINPVLCDSYKIIKAHKLLKDDLKMSGIDIDLDNKLINRKVAPKMMILKQDIFKHTHQKEHIKFNLRSIYAALCYKLFQPNMSYRAYTAKILNHSDLQSAESYDQYNPV